MQNQISVYKTLEGRTQYLAAYNDCLRLWPVSYTSCFVSTIYGQIHVITCGSKDAFPLVLLHGGYASATMWFANIADLSASYRVYALDTIGEPGMSEPATPTSSREACADWIIQALDSLGIETAHVVGLSRGGWLALNLALRAPRRVASLALLSPAASFIRLTPFFRMLAAGLIRIPNKGLLKAALYSWVAPGFVINELFTRQFVLGLYHWNWAVNRKGYSGVMPTEFSVEELDKLRMPILMLTGDHDRLNPLRAIQRALQTIPHLETAIVPQAGHMLSMEQPDFVDKYVLNFLGRGKNAPEQAKPFCMTRPGPCHLNNPSALPTSDRRQG
jgi:pimeloyl-ACP methyl ester carboxylesterase